MEIKRVWEMPNCKTFSMNCIKDFICNNIKHLNEGIVLDPFANEHSISNHISYKLKYISNDIDKEYDTDFHMDALDFLKQYKDNSIDVVLFDPPYSTRQVSECYTKIGKIVTSLDTSNNFWTRIKSEIQRIVKVDGIVFSFGWNSNGIGEDYFDKEQILMVAHGGNHNDTICVLERKKSPYYEQLSLF